MATSDCSSDTVSDKFSFDYSHSSTSQFPIKARRRPPPLRLNHVGIDPSDIIGKVLTRVRRSSNHPALTLDFADNTTFQILVDGYDPIHRGVPKQLEMDPSLDQILNPRNNQILLDLPIVDCALITLTDKAFERRQNTNFDEVRRGLGDLHWDQNHSGVAFKFAEETPQWHCVWATLQDYDEQLGVCVFRSYDDVYLQRLHRSPHIARHRR